MRPKGNPHPSGRPIRPRIVKGRSIWRVPESEAVTPRLRPQRQSVEAIGFVHDFERFDDDE